MEIIKSNGTKQTFAPGKIWKRIKDQCKGLHGTNPDILFQKIVPSIQDGMTTTAIDEILAYKAADLIIEHPDYSLFGGRILMTRQSKIIGVPCQDVDLQYDIFGALTFLKKYSVRNDKGEPIELPHMMYNRVASFLSDTHEEQDKFANILLSRRGSVATPILTNGGTSRKGLISCNLTKLESDSTEGILNTLNAISEASREGAGIGLSIDCLRSKDSLVSSFKDKAGGVTRFADMVQSHMRFFRQGARSGSCALYLSVWHKDVLDFLELRLPIGDEKLRARDVFTAITLNDVFMNCLKDGRDWYLFCPNDIKKSGLTPFENLHGDAFKSEYDKAVELGIGTPINPKRIWDAIITSMVKSGTPYIFHKDNANKHNMQNNIGVVKQSNLCVHGDTLILTRQGYLKISELVGKQIECWNGEEWSTVMPTKTGIDKELLRIEFSNGHRIDCTNYHKFYIFDPSKSTNEIEVRAEDLTAGDELYRWNIPQVVTGMFQETIIGVKVKATNKLEGLHDTYCVTEPLRGKVIFNGILTGNCAEITEVSDSNYTAQCTLGLVNLAENPTMFEIEETAYTIALMLNKVIDKTHYPNEAAEKAGKEQRAIAIGVAGLADFYAKANVAFYSEEAKELNKEIFKALYRGAFTASNELGEIKCYPAWQDSPYSKGYDIRGKISDEPIKMANSLLIGLMPSASTSILLGVNECFEPFNSNIYTRATGIGEFVLINKYLVADLERLGLWTPDIRKRIVADSGSVQRITEIPDDLKLKYLTVWEIPMKHIVDMAADRQLYIDQSQSMNLYFANPDYTKISSALIYGWQWGLKTGCYYLKTQSQVDKPVRLFASTEKRNESAFAAECASCAS